MCTLATATSVSAKDDIGERTAEVEVDLAKTVIGLAGTGFNVICVSSAITKLALVYIQHLHPKCPNINLSVTYSDVYFAFMSQILQKVMVKILQYAIENYFETAVEKRMKKN